MLLHYFHRRFFGFIRKRWRSLLSYSMKSPGVKGFKLYFSMIWILY
jgi:hypothetical protein